MPHILSTLDFTPEIPKDESYSKPTGLRAWSLMIRKLYEQLARVLNGNVSFGSLADQTLTGRDNIAGVWVPVPDTGLADTDFTVTINLGKIPVGYWLMQADRAVSIYTGTAPWTDNTITLKANVANASILLFVV